jgi:hypothetical protein
MKLHCTELRDKGEKESFSQNFYLLMLLLVAMERKGCEIINLSV